MLLNHLSYQSLIFCLCLLQSHFVLSLNILNKRIVLFLESRNLKFVPFISCSTLITQPPNISGITLLKFSNRFLVSYFALLNVRLKLKVSLILLFTQLFQFQLLSTQQVSDLNLICLLLILQIISVFLRQCTYVSILCVQLSDQILLLSHSLLSQIFDSLAVIAPQLILFPSVLLQALRMRLFELVKSFRMIL